MKIVDLIRSDYYRYYGFDCCTWIEKMGMVLKALLAFNHSFTYSFWFRLASDKNLFYPVARYMHWHLSRRYGIQIPYNTKIGYGLYIGHGVGIIIHPKTIIGNNCNISQFLTIGSNKNMPAIIGDNVYIGPSVCIVENVKIGDNVSIGAGSVVTKDVPDSATIVGVPAKVLHYNNPGQFICNRWKMNL